MKISKSNYLHTSFIGLLILLIQISCSDCKTPGGQADDSTKSTYQVILDGIDPSTPFENTHTFSIKNQDNKNAVNTKDIVLSIRSAVAVKLNNHLVTTLDTSLKDILEEDKMDKGATKPITLQVVDAQGQVAATMIILQLKDKQGNKLGEEKKMTWEPKKEVQLILNVTNQDLQGNEVNDRKIECTVTNAGAVSPQKGKIVLQLIPEPGTTATITGAAETTDGSGKKTYTYDLKEQEIGTIISFQIEPQGSKEATFKAQLIYDGKPMGGEKVINWQAAATLVLSVTKQDLQGNEVNDRKIECTVTNTGAVSPQKGKAVLQLIPELGTTATITGAAETTDGSGRKSYTYDLKEQEIGTIISFQIEPQGSKEATFKVQLIYDGKPMGGEKPINWKAAAPPPVTEFTQEMIDAAAKEAGNRRTRQLFDVLQALHKNQDLANKINAVDSSCPFEAKAALTQAIAMKRPDIVRLLLAKGADVNGQGTTGDTPLVGAVTCLSEEMVRLLLEHKGIQNKKTDGKGKDLLLSIAVRQNNSLENREKVITPLEKLLLDQLDKADIDKAYTTMAQDGKYLLCLSTSWGRWKVAQALLDKGADPNPQGIVINTPLILAILHDAKDLAHSLVSKGAKTDLPFQPIPNSDTLWKTMLAKGWDPGTWT